MSYRASHIKLVYSEGASNKCSSKTKTNYACSSIQMSFLLFIFIVYFLQSQGPSLQDGVKQSGRKPEIPGQVQSSHQIIHAYIHYPFLPLWLPFLQRHRNQYYFENTMLLYSINTGALLLT